MSKRKPDLLLIDGYNLLNASNIVGTAGRTALEGSREALLDWLFDELAEDERARTTIVFDSAGAPPGLPKLMFKNAVCIRFAARGLEADDELEKLIAEHSAPRTLTVVSSDHRVQRAARRRSAQAIDSEQWISARQRNKSTPDKSPDRDVELSADEVQGWLDEFSDPPGES